MAAERLKALFGEALDVPAAERSAFLDAACADDAPLRRELERLLGAHDAAGDFLAHPVALVEAAACELREHDDGLVPGTRIGAHELLERLGTGGFGSVWRARQLEPVTREVAIKVLHGAFDGERVAARFQAERQALARMEHPGIAKVFDAGTTAEGRPWLSMELVAGEAITAHCERERLPLRARLSLFVEVCLAVQHAHGKAVVHRDLKPSNVLVTARDGTVRPVLVDFGVACALDERADVPPGDGSPLGTPDYMSPEQAAADHGTVDTRTDVYSLGVILYELTCGRRPHERAPGESAWDLLRRIRTEVPPPPSARTSVRLPRELDWITARAMAHDPAARYPTAVALADDVRRMLQWEPVLAAPPSWSYRASRFVRRHALAVGALAAIVSTLGASTWITARAAERERGAAAMAVASLQRAREAEAQARADQQQAERSAARANRALALLDELWSGVDPARLGRSDYPVRELLGDFERALSRRTADEPSVELPVRRTLARLHLFVGQFDRAIAHATRAAALAADIADPAAHAAALLLRARARFDGGDVAGARADADAIHALHAASPLSDRLLANVLEVQANCAQRHGDGDGALAAAERSLALRRALGDSGEIARGEMLLGSLHGGVGRVELAMEHVEAALECLEPLGELHPDTLVAVQHRALLHQRRGDLFAAEAGFRDSLQRRVQVYGDDHPHVAWARADLAWLLQTQRRHAEAAELLRRALPVLRERLGEDHLYVSEAMQRLGAVLVDLGELDEAGRLLETAAERYRTLPAHPVDGLIGCLGNLSSLQWARGERAAAIATRERALEAAVRELPAAHFLVSIGRTNLAYLLAQEGGIERAITLLEQALEGSLQGGRTGEADVQRQRLAALLRRAGRAADAERIERQGR